MTPEPLIKPLLKSISNRLLLVFVLLGLMLSIVLGRLYQLHFLHKDFLQHQGDVRSLRTEELSVHRGNIYDRNGLPLAVSTPVITLWANPKLLSQQPETSLEKLSQVLAIDYLSFVQRLEDYNQREFMYLHRQLTPDEAEKVLSLGINGVYGQNEYKRYYPAGEVTSHLIGFTNLDQQGQEGLELAWNNWLVGKSGQKRVIKDLKGRTVRNLAVLRHPQPGKDLHLSLDLNLQYLAYRELKAVVDQHRAASGSLVMLDATNGEVLAMVNQPSFNPNNRLELTPEKMRNRAFVDLFEPGSVIKPLSVAVAFAEGGYNKDSIIDTHPGSIRLGGHRIRDARNYGKLSPEKVLVYSSNVGVTKMTEQLEEDTLVNYYSALGLGQPTNSNFPGEAASLLPYAKSPITRATLSYGYGLAVNLAQLAQAYTALADEGRLHQLSLLKVDAKQNTKQVFSAEVAQQVLNAMEKVVEPGGTGRRAAIRGYKVAGKTGTVHKLSKSDGYESGNYLATFAGIAPASNPKLIAVVVIDSPQGQEYFGGEVAAPVFSRVVGQALRRLNIPPDAPEELSP